MTRLFPVGEALLGDGLFGGGGGGGSASGWFLLDLANPDATTDPNGTIVSAPVATGDGWFTADLGNGGMSISDNKTLGQLVFEPSVDFTARRTDVDFFVQPRDLTDTGTNVSVVAGICQDLTGWVGVPNPALGGGYQLAIPTPNDLTVTNVRPGGAGQTTNQGTHVAGDGALCRHSLLSRPTCFASQSAITRLRPSTGRVWTSSRVTEYLDDFGSSPKLVVAMGMLFNAAQVNDHEFRVWVKYTPRHGTTV